MTNYQIWPNRTPSDSNLCHFTGAHYTYDGTAYTDGTTKT